MSANAVIANTYSRAVLLVVEQESVESSENADYFPSYGIAIPGRTMHFQEEKLYISDEFVEQIAHYMI